MVRLFLRRHLPSRAKVKRIRWLRPIAPWLSAAWLWRLSPNSVAGGVLIGVYAGLIPGPIQVPIAILLAVLTRVNLPIAMITTLYSNPFTIVPIYAVALSFGHWLLGVPLTDIADMPAWGNISVYQWPMALFYWLTGMGAAFAVGLIAFGSILGITLYLIIQIGWRGSLWWRLRRRRIRQHIWRQQRQARYPTILEDKR